MWGAGRPPSLLAFSSCLLLPPPTTYGAGGGQRARLRVHASRSSPPCPSRCAPHAAHAAQDSEDDYLVDHSIITYLVNPEGKFVTFYGKVRFVRREDGREAAGPPPAAPARSQRCVSSAPPPHPCCPACTNCLPAEHACRTSRRMRWRATWRTTSSAGRRSTPRGRASERAAARCGTHLIYALPPISLCTAVPRLDCARACCKG